MTAFAETAAALGAGSYGWLANWQQMVDAEHADDADGTRVTLIHVGWE